MRTNVGSGETISDPWARRIYHSTMTHIIDIALRARADGFIINAEWEEIIRRAREESTETRLLTNSTYLREESLSREQMEAELQWLQTHDLDDEPYVDEFTQSSFFALQAELLAKLRGDDHPDILPSLLQGIERDSTPNNASLFPLLFHYYEKRQACPFMGAHQTLLPDTCRRPSTNGPLCPTSAAVLPKQADRRPRLAIDDIDWHLNDIRRQPSPRRLLILVLHILAGFAHRLDDLVQRHKMLAVPRQRQPHRINRLVGTNGIALNTRNLHQPANRITSQPQVMLHRNFSGILNLLRRRATDFRKTRRRHGTSRTDLPLTTDFRAANRSILLAQRTDRRRRQKKADDPLLIRAGRMIKIIMQHRRNNARRPVGRSRHNSPAGGVLLIHGNRINIHPINHRKRISGGIAPRLQPLMQTRRTAFDLQPTGSVPSVRHPRSTHSRITRQISSSSARISDSLRNAFSFSKTRSLMDSPFSAQSANSVLPLLKG